MAIKRSHYLWILGTHMLGLVGGVAGGFLARGYVDGIWEWALLVVSGALLGSYLLSSVVVAALSPKKRIVAYYIGSLFLLQIGEGMLIAGLLLLLRLMASILPFIPDLASPIMHLLHALGWSIIPAIAYYLATRQRRIEIPV